jgi:hypothetical protein
MKRGSIASAQAEPSLDDLARQIRTWVAEIHQACLTALGHAMDCGDALNEAQSRISGGGWKRWLRENCLLGVSTAQLYQQLARHREEIESEILRVPDLSLRAARRLITKAPTSESTVSETEDTTTESGTASRTSTQNDRLPLASVKAAAMASAEVPKGETSPTEGRAFDLMTSLVAADDDEVTVVLAAFGLPRFLECMPPGWRSVLETRCSERLSALRLVDLLERRLERDGIAAPVRLQKIRDRIEQSRPQIDLTAVRAVGSASADILTANTLVVTAMMQGIPNGPAPSRSARKTRR